MMRVYNIIHKPWNLFMNYIFAVLRLVAIVFGLEILFILMLASGPSLLAESKLDDPAAIPVPWVAPTHKDTILSPTPSPLVVEPSLPPVDGHLERKIFGWSQYKSTVSYHVVDQCLCPPHTTATTSSLFDKNQIEDDCSLSGVYAQKFGNIH
jgi:hypothetical protein